METPTTPRSTLNPPVFYTSAALILALVLFTVLLQEEAQSLFNHVQQWIITNASWFYVLAVALILISVVFLAVSRYGDIKLGPDHSRPDYRNTTWFAMLFSAGMGIGLMFFGVAEPVMHFTTPPVGEPNTVQAAKEAMKLTFFHWGLHAWAIYAIVALILAFFSYRHGLPLTLRSALYPLIGERIYGRSGASEGDGWQRRLRNIAMFPRRSHVNRFITDVARPACEDVAAELRKQGYEVQVQDGEDGRVRLEVSHGGEVDFIYEVRPRAFTTPSFVMRDTEDSSESRKYFRAEVHLQEGGQDYDIMGWSRDGVIGDILDQYERHMHFLHVVR